MRLPAARGPFSAALFAHLADPSLVPPGVAELDQRGPADAEATVQDGDEQVALWALFELSYTGFDEVGEALEWDPVLIAIRNGLSDGLEHSLRELTADEVRRFPASVDDVGDELLDFVATFEGPSPGRYLRNHATVEQAREMLVLRSIYTLKEADPHTWVIPRLSGDPKCALATVQFDEYGAGRPERLHSRIFADAMRSAGLDARVGAYIDDVPSVILANANMLSLFGLHRRLRACAMGHLAAFEATSSLPARDIAAGLERLGLSDVMPYFEEHVEADAVHEQVAARMICAEMVAQDPQLLPDVVLGAAACLVMDSLVGRHMLEHWTSGRSALRTPALATRARVG